jgi:DNA-binding NtrC family response regulator
MTKAQNIRTRSAAEKMKRVQRDARPDAVRVMGTSRIVRLGGPGFSVGTAEDNDLVLADRFISKRHCALMTKRDGLWVHDHGSRNGTWVDSVRVERCRVTAGSRIFLGRTCLQLLGPESSRPHPFGLVGDHASIQRVLEQIERFGPTLKPALILGETGTGKELVARALHQCSPHRLGQFEPVNSGAIPADLAESELFGHAEGAFTGASRARRGAFERADAGTLFLDEVGELPLKLQPKLLRALEEQEIQRIGEDQPRPVQIRLVAATHRDLIRDVEQQRFRLDLFHRLAVAVIQLPPLRERREDIPQLVQHFLSREQPQGGEVAVTDAGMRFLMNHHWGGNVRELRNLVEVASSLGKPRLEPADLKEILNTVETCSGSAVGFVRYRGREFEEVKREVFTRTIRELGGNRTAAAQALGIPKSTFFDQVYSMGIRC